MLKYYVKATEALKSLRTDTKGVVSFEYVIVATVVVSAVIAAFSTNAGNITSILSDALTAISGKIAGV